MLLFLTVACFIAISINTVCRSLNHVIGELSATDYFSAPSIALGWVCVCVPGQLLLAA